ncbi:VOC family protein [Ruicaihuangia caeni]|uniref:Methylmalonyl-CoA epimerase n=1 Tax=Ruicaihuangia caeni TaxID=3042517 RepID=A0AAW6T6P0_9MICO|nr:VOC family protein [Klugiella sp. YN-L-19]MDI2099164.1 methylmalonyl-CoA epimerase [Klugiella sp. YN-L-19]
MEVLQVTQHAEDVDRASRFYQALLGYAPIRVFDHPKQVYFTVGPLRLLIEEAAPSSLFYLQVDNVRDAVSNLRAQGIEILAEPRLQFSHGLDHDADLFGPADADEWVALVRDSEGNPLGLMSHEARHEP